jgi:hypothetical protein
MAQDPINKATTAPNLPVTPTVYSSQHFDILNNVLRLYFNQISSSINNLTAIPTDIIFPDYPSGDTYVAGVNTTTVPTAEQTLSVIRTSVDTWDLQTTTLSTSAPTGGSAGDVWYRYA